MTRAGTTTVLGYASDLTVTEGVACTKWKTSDGAVVVGVHPMMGGVHPQGTGVYLVR